MDEATTLQIEAKLDRERTNIALLEQNLSKYNNLTINASKILKNFESRLLKVNNVNFNRILVKFYRYLNLDAGVKRQSSEVIELCSSKTFRQFFSRSLSF